MSKTSSKIGAENFRFSFKIQNPLKIWSGEAIYGPLLIKLSEFDLILLKELRHSSVTKWKWNVM